MSKSLEFSIAERKLVPISKVSTLPHEVQKMLMQEGLTSVEDLLKKDPFEFSLDYGMDIQASMLAFREASILQEGRIPSLAPFPQSPIYLNASYLSHMEDQIWLAGITTGVSILHWLSFSTEVDEEIILRKLEFHLLPVAKNRPIVLVSQLPETYNVLIKKAKTNGLDSLLTLLKTNTLELSEFIDENVLWKGHPNIGEIIEWLAFPTEYDVNRQNEIPTLVQRDFHFYGKLRKQTALDAVRVSVDLFEAINYLKDHIIVV